MKIVVTSQGENLNSPVDPRFGRGQWFLVLDTESGEYRSVDNAQNLNLAQGAGIQAAQNVSGLGAEAVLTGHCGPKAFRALSAAGIKVYVGAQGTVSETVERFKSGELALADGPDVAGHWA
jgi:predicted Fe-Mo cluster-binding NifX family protein